MAFQPDKVETPFIILNYLASHPPSTASVNPLT